jgi:hypothetical protein
MGEPSFVVVEKNRPWLVAHEALSRLARERAAADAEEGRWLLAALRAATHVHLGFGSFAEYIERSFGYKPRSTQEKLRVAAALEGLPLLSRALAEAALHWSSVRELTRVAVAATEREWLELARGKTLRQVEELVAGRHLGADPAGPRDPAAERHVLSFEVAPETFALFREARSELRRRCDAALDDDAVLLEMSCSAQRRGSINRTRVPMTRWNRALSSGSSGCIQPSASAVSRHASASRVEAAAD